MVKKNDAEPDRQHRTLDLAAKKELGEWLTARAGVAGVLHGTREGLAHDATKALGFVVSSSSITTVAGGWKLKFAGKTTSGKGKAAPPGNTNQQLGRVVKELYEKVAACVPGFRLSETSVDILDKIVKAWKVPVADAVPPQVNRPQGGHPVAQYDQQGHANSSAFAAAQAIEISRQQNAGHAAPQPTPRWPWPAPPQSAENLSQQELPFSG